MPNGIPKNLGVADSLHGIPAIDLHRLDDDLDRHN